MASRSTSSRLALAIIALILFSVFLVNEQPTSVSSKPSGASTNAHSCNLPLFSPSTPWFYYPTSCIRILIVYDLSTGARVYGDKWGSLLADYGYNITLLPIQQVTANISLTSSFDLILVDHSCGGENGTEISSAEANMLSETNKPLILLGGAHGVIDRLANYSGGMGRASVAGIVQKAKDETHHEIYSSPYLIAEVGADPPNSIEIFNQTCSLESYPESGIEGLYAFSVILGAPKPVIGALYSPQKSIDRMYWWAFQDPSTLDTNGRQLFINTIEWMGGFTDLQLLYDFIQGTQSTDPSKSTYWTGGFGDYFEPQIPPTYYAYESLRLAGRLNAINSSALVTWLTKYCYSSDGGFFRSPNRYLLWVSWSAVVETGMALQILSSLGALNAVNLTKISTYIKSCQLTDGFVRYSGDTCKSMTNTYWALIALNITGAVDSINKTSALCYILSCQNTNPIDTSNYGGFADSPGGASHASYTFIALRSLEMLSSMNQVNQAIIENWLMNGYVASKGMFYDEQIAYQRYMVNYGTGYSVASLSLLGKLGRINQSLVANYLASVQFSDGGWSGANCTDESIDEVADCYPVMLGLGELNRINAIKDLEGFVGFLTRCLSPPPTYGFSSLPGTLSNVWDTYNGIEALHDIGLLDTETASVLNSSIISSYEGYFGRFEFLRCTYPASSDGYKYQYMDEPFEFSFLQRYTCGAMLTDLAIMSLMNIGSNNWINNNAQKIWNELRQCEVTTGSYMGYYKSFSTALANNLTAGMRYTYHALNCLWTLAGFLNFTSSFSNRLINASMTIQRIMSLYDPLTGNFRDDGYLLEPYSPVETTYMALCSLQLLNAVNGVDYIKTSEYLESHLYSNLVDAYYSFRGLQALNKLDVVNATKLLELVRECQKPCGMFAPDNSVLYRLETTRMATEILNYYNQTWIAARQTKIVINSISLPSTMYLGSTYTLNLSLTDSQFNLPIGGATVKIRLGTHEFTATESSPNSGSYAVNLPVPIDRHLLGTQYLTIRASKDRLQTNLNQTVVQISSNGIVIKLQTEVAFIEPSDNDYLTTTNTSASALIRALNDDWVPIGGVELQLYVNDSLVDTMSSNSSGQTTSNWKPNSSGTYDLRIVFEGSETLNASWATKVVNVEKTPTKLTLTSSNSDLDNIDVGTSIQLTSELVEVNGSREEQLFGANITFIVSTPSGRQFQLSATTARNGTASMQLAINETGDYSAYSIFGSTDYYSSSKSESIALKAVSDGGQPGNGNGGSGSGNEGPSWLDALLNAISSPGGIGLLIASACLLSVVWYLGVKQRELESLDNRSNQHKGRRNLATDDSTPRNGET